MKQQRISPGLFKADIKAGDKIDEWIYAFCGEDGSVERLNVSCWSSEWEEIKNIKFPN